MGKAINVEKLMVGAVLVAGIITADCSDLEQPLTLTC